VTENTTLGVDAMILLAEAIRAAALDVPGVLDLSPGVGYVEATYGRNRAVLGVGVERQPDHIAVNLHVIVAEEPVHPLAHRIREAVRARVRAEVDTPAQPINLWIDDMRLAEPVSSWKGRS